SKQAEIGFEPEQAATFAAHETAWTWFQSQPPGYQRQATWWVISAKRPETRDRRLLQLIDDSANGRRLKQFARG
ncbi:MAG: YdeI/OmpD-associated family protein, partial [Chloroflexia bacterium]|nr:YdeI/OmpD-associated family protein [Chloroflexia bacterium]